MILQCDGGNCVFLVTSDQTMLVAVFGRLCPLPPSGDWSLLHPGDWHCLRGSLTVYMLPFVGKLPPGLALSQRVV